MNMQSLTGMKPYLTDGLGIAPECLSDCFRPAAIADLPRILALRQAVLGPGLRWDDAHYWRWKYLEQPGASDTDIPYWVFEKEGEIIGGMGLQRIRVAVTGKIHPATWSCDIMVRPDFDGRGLGVLMNLLFQETFPFLLVLGTNARSTPMLSRLFRQLPSLRCYKKLIRTGPFLEHRLGSHAVGVACATVLDPLLALYDRRHRVQNPQGVTFARIGPCDAQFDSLWERTRHGPSVRVQRSAEHLAWRFFDNPKWDYECHGAFAQGVLLGYVVIRVSRKERDVTGTIVDWLCDAPILPPLFQYAILRLADDGVSTIYTHAYDREAETALDRLGFVRDEEADSPFFVGSCPPEIKAEVFSAQNWILTPGDSDID